MIEEARVAKEGAGPIGARCIDCLHARGLWSLDYAVCQPDTVEVRPMHRACGAFATAPASEVARRWRVWAAAHEGKQ